MPSPLPRRNRWVRTSFSFPNGGGLPRISAGSASALPFSRPAQRSLLVTACALAESLTDPFTSEASSASLPPRPFRLLPAGTTLAGWDLHPLRPCTFARHTEKCGLAAALRTSPTRTQIISPSIHRHSVPAASKVTNRNSPRSRGLGRVVGIRALALHAVPIHSLVSVPWGIPPADTPMTPRPLDPDQWEIARRALHHLAHGETARQETRVRGSVPYRNTVRSSSRAALGMRRKYRFYWRSGRNATKMRTVRFPRRSRRVRGWPSSTARRERPCGTG